MSDRISTDRAKETFRKEMRSEPLETQIDRIIELQLEKGHAIPNKGTYFEVPDKMVMFYKYSYGMQSRFFRELKENARLMASECRKCGTVYFPPRAHCGECYTETDWREISREGIVIHATTSWYATSEFFDRVPYAVGYVKPLDADTGILQRIDHGNRETIKSGTRVTAVFAEKRKGKASDFWYRVNES